MSAGFNLVSGTLSILGLVALAACGSGGAAHGPVSPDASAAVDMGFTSFTPQTVHIHVGQRVEFRNTALITHSVTDDVKLAEDATHVALPAGATPFFSGDLAAGKVYETTFLLPGTYKFICTHHEGMGMMGTVIVDPAP